MLSVQGISKKYKRFAIRDLTFEVPRGSITGLLGRNGAGKTTTLNILLGQTRKDGGIIRVNGTDLDREPLKAKGQMGFIVDAPAFLSSFTLWENGVQFGRFYEGFSEKKWRKWLDLCGLRGKDRLERLSKGEQVKFQFAFAMAHDPRVLLLDEPTGNLDPVFRREFLEMLQEAVEEQKISVLFSSHLTTDMELTADQIILLEQGRRLYAGPQERLKERYQLIKGSPETGRMLKSRRYPGVCGITVTNVGFEAMVDLEQGWKSGNEILGLVQEEISLSQWMYYMTKGAELW